MASRQHEHACDSRARSRVHVQHFRATTSSSSSHQHHSRSYLSDITAFASHWRTLVLILSSHRTISDFRIARTSAEAASWYRGQLPGYPIEPHLIVPTNLAKCSDQYEYQQGRRVHCAQLYATPSRSGEASVVDGVELSAGQLRPNANHHFETRHIPSLHSKHRGHLFVY